MAARPLTLKQQAIFWACVIVFLLLAVILLRSALLPFVIGLAVAYLLNPLVEKLGRVGIARKPATITILGGFLVIVLLFVAALLPIISREMSLFASDLPHYIEKFWQMIAPVTAMLDRYIGGTDEEALKNLLKQNSGSAIGVANFLIRHVAASGQAILDAISVALFMPVAAYFMMVEWERICAWVRGLIPRGAEEAVMKLLSEMDKKLSGFVRGQVSVAAVLGISYAFVLTIAGLKYGVLIGLSSGFLSVIPMVGSAVGLIVSVAISWFQSGDLSFVALIACIFIGGQLIEGNLLTPKLVGDSVGLHPLWIFFSLLAGASLLGVLGMFLAVPVAAVTGVLTCFALRQYKQSKYYDDSQPAEDKQAHKKKTRKKHEHSDAAEPQDNNSSGTDPV